MGDTITTTFGDTYQLWITALDSTYRELVETGAALVPKLLGAALLLLLGWLLALLLRFLILRLATGLDRLYESLRLRAGVDEPAVQWPVSRVVAITVYWLVLLFFIVVAANVLGLPGVADVFGAVLAFLPTLVLTGAALFVIVLLSSAVGQMVTRSADAAGLTSAAGLGALTRVLLIGIASIMALAQIGVDTTLLVNVFTVVVAAFFAGAALAFGIGASGAVRNLIAAHHARSAYRTGQRIRVAGQEGEIVEFTPVAVMLETQAGRARIPAARFAESASVLVDAEATDA